MSTTGCAVSAKPSCGQADKGYGRGKGKDHRDRDGAGEGGGKRGRWTRSEKGKGKGAGGQKRSFYSQEDDRMEDMVRGA